MNKSWEQTHSIPYASKDKIYLFKIDLETVAMIKNINYLLPFLSIKEKDRITKFRFDKDKLCYGIGRAAIKMIFSKHLNVKPNSINFQIHKYGKPFIENRLNLNFNISHSNNLVLLGIGLDYELGVDVELNNYSFDHLELSKSVFSKAEQLALNNAPKDRVVEGFYNCWTMKESFIKALGLGLQIPLDEFSVNLFNKLSSENNLREVTWEPSLTKVWKVLNIDIKQAYNAAYTCNNQIKDVRRYDMTQFFKKQILSLSQL